MVKYDYSGKTVIIYGGTTGIGLLVILAGIPIFYGFSRKRRTDA